MSRGIAVPVNDLGARWGWMVITTPRPFYPRKGPGACCTGGWVGPRADLDGCGKSHPPTWIRFPYRPARSESLYRLSYPGQLYTCVIMFFSLTVQYISIHLWRYSPFWALATVRRCLHSSVSSPRLLHPLIPRILQDIYTYYVRISRDVRANTSFAAVFISYINQCA